MRTLTNANFNGSFHLRFGREVSGDGQRACRHQRNPPKSFTSTCRNRAMAPLPPATPPATNRRWPMYSTLRSLRRTTGSSIRGSRSPAAFAGRRRITSPIMTTGRRASPLLTLWMETAKTRRPRPCCAAVTDSSMTGLVTGNLLTINRANVQNQIVLNAPDCTSPSNATPAPLPLDLGAVNTLAPLT